MGLNMELYAINKKTGDKAIANIFLDLDNLDLDMFVTDTESDILRDMENIDVLLSLAPFIEGDIYKGTGFSKMEIIDDLYNNSDNSHFIYIVKPEMLNKLLILIMEYGKKYSIEELSTCQYPEDIGRYLTYHELTVKGLLLNRFIIEIKNLFSFTNYNDTKNRDTTFSKREKIAPAEDCLFVFKIS